MIELVGFNLFLKGWYMLFFQISLIGEDSIIGRTVVVYSKSNPDPGLALAWGKQVK